MSNLEQLYRLQDLVNILKISRSTIYAGIKDGTFPKPFKLSKRKTAWTHNQIEEWMKQRKEDV